jgi:hypothetical protein
MAEDAPRLEASVEGMRDYYPAFSFSFVETAAGRLGVWTGRVQPIRTTDRLEDLLDDIHHERPYYILPGGEMLHHPVCSAVHENHGWAEKLSNPHAVYELEIRYGGGKRHPKAYVRDPALPEEKRRHTFGDGSICPYAPWHQVWRWEEHTVVDYMAHALGWLIKWTVWDQVGVWIGPEIDHDPRFLLRSIGPNKPCWCGSGNKYKRCHRPTDESSVRSQT